jgi:hypothetical protein
MKKQILLIVAIVCSSAGQLFAQIKVTQNGRVAMGTNSMDSANKVAIDGTRFTALHLTSNHLNDSGISMLSHVNRCSTKCYVVELDTHHTFWVNGCGKVTSQGGALFNGIVTMTQEVQINNANLTVTNGHVHVEGGGITSTGAIKTKTHIIQPDIFTRIARFFSDSTLKCDFDTIATPMDKIQALKAYSFRYNDLDVDTFFIDTSLNGRYIGFKAQEVADILPEVVGYEYGNDTNKMGIDYGAMVALLVEGMKVQANQISALQSTISTMATTISDQTDDIITLQSSLEEISSRLDICCPHLDAEEGANKIGNNTLGGKNGVTNAEVKNLPKLYQNNPNPFSQDTRIAFFLPANCGPAMIVISDLTGKQVQKVDIKTAETKEITIKAGSMAAGTYNYTLVCQGKVIDTKQMMIIE